MSTVDKVQPRTQKSEKKQEGMIISKGSTNNNKIPIYLSLIRYN